MSKNTNTNKMGNVKLADGTKAPEKEAKKDTTFKAEFTKKQYDVILQSLNALLGAYGLKMAGIPFIIKRYQVQFSEQRSINKVVLSINHSEAVLIEKGIDGVLMAVAKSKIDMDTSLALVEAHKIISDGYIASGGIIEGEVKGEKKKHVLKEEKGQ